MGKRTGGPDQLLNSPDEVGQSVMKLYGSTLNLKTLLTGFGLQGAKLVLGVITPIEKRASSAGLSCLEADCLWQPSDPGAGTSDSMFAYVVMGPCLAARFVSVWIVVHNPLRDLKRGETLWVRAHWDTGSGHSQDEVGELAPFVSDECRLSKPRSHGPANRVGEKTRQVEQAHARACCTWRKWPPWEGFAAVVAHENQLQAFSRIAEL